MQKLSPSGYIIPDNTLDTTSENPVQNKVVANKFNEIQDGTNLDSFSDVETKFGDYLPLSGGTMTGDLNIDDNLLKFGIPFLQYIPQGSGDCFRFRKDSSTYGDIDCGNVYANNLEGQLVDVHGGGIVNLASPVIASDGANKGYVDTRTPNFSTTEVATNRTWTDGKVIYQRTISGTLSVTTTLTAYMLLQQTDIETPIEVSGFVANKNVSNYSSYSVPLYPLAAQRYFAPFVNNYTVSPTTNRGFKVYASWEYAVTVSYDLTFLYTKQT